ncbi:MAG: B3/4 domain-containing protein [Muribaculaceae bacterium]
MKTLVVSDEIRAKAPALRVLQIEAEIENPDTPEALWAELEALAADVHGRYAMEMVNKRPAIAATRTAYKACGKEPNRYRPSSEALMRRMVKGLELYRTAAVIDLINLLSVACGHSIGGFDADRIDGDTVTLGIGREGEPYEAIGRGPLNIAGMPVWRDNTGGIGTPTSDNERTKLSPSTRRLLMIVNMYGDEMPVADIEALARRLLVTYASAKNIQTRLLD